MFTEDSSKRGRGYGLQEMILRQIFRTKNNTDYNALKSKIEAAFPEDEEMSATVAKASYQEERERELVADITETFMEKLTEGLYRGESPDFLIEKLENYLEGIDEGLYEAREHTLLALIEVLLENRFGEAGLELFQEIQEIEDIKLLEAIYEKVDTVETLEALRRIYE